MDVLVTGADGMLGQDLCPILEDEGYNVIESNKDSLDILDEMAIKKMFNANNIDIVVHTAAFTNVDKAEKDKKLAEKINVIGTKNIAKACHTNNATLVYISTDYIFDGNKDLPYGVDDTPNPLNIYGKTKLSGEYEVKKYCKNYYIVRTSLLYGVHGNNFVEAIIAQTDNKEISVVNDLISCPTWTIDLANGIVELLQNYDSGVYNICGSGEVSRFEFAKEILKLVNWNGQLKPVNLEFLNNCAKRPRYSSLEPSIKTKKWQMALREYIALRS